MHRPGPHLAGDFRYGLGDTFMPVWSARSSRGTEGFSYSLDGLPLLVTDVIGNCHPDADEEVTLSLVRTATADPERAPVRRTGGNAQTDGRPVHGGDLDLRAQHGLGPTDRCIEQEGPADGEHRVGSDCIAARRSLGGPPFTPGPPLPARRIFSGRRRPRRGRGP